MAISLLSFSQQVDANEQIFRLRKGITFYLVNEGVKDFSITIKKRDMNLYCRGPRELLVRIFDPDENLIVWHEMPDDGIENGEKRPYIGVSDEFQDLRHDIYSDMKHDPLNLPVQEQTFNITDGEKGIYQVICIGEYDHYVELQTEPKMEYGVMGHAEWLCGRGEQFKNSYFYIPRNTEKVGIVLWVDNPLADRQVILFDETGQKVMEVKNSDRVYPAGGFFSDTKGVKEYRSYKEVTPRGKDVVWNLQVSGQGDYYLHFHGLPVILTFDKESAQKIQASVEYLPDGTTVYHKFQRKIYEILKRFKREDLEVPIIPFSRYEKEFLSEPVRNSILFGTYGVLRYLPLVLKAQNIDPSSHWFGSIELWNYKIGKPYPENRWDRNGLVDFSEATSFRSPQGFPAGGSIFCPPAWNEIMAFAYAENQPWNPYYHNKGLLNRIILINLKNLMSMDEAEFFKGQGCWDYSGGYYGRQAYSLLHTYTYGFSLVYPYLLEDVRQVWREGLQRFVDRLSLAEVRETCNQWSWFPLATAYFHKATGDERYKKIALRHAHRMIDGSYGWGGHPAGYFAESFGPDAQYNGMSTHSLAIVYQITEDEKVKEALRRSFNLFNHTVAPEPDGRIFGATNFNQRTGGSFICPFYWGGLGIMADELPEAALWNLAKEYDCQDRKNVERCIEKIKSEFKNPVKEFDKLAAEFSVYEDLPYYNYFPERVLNGQLPVIKETNFTRIFGDAFYCFRRPGYYALIYADHPAPLWWEIHHPGPSGQWPRTGGGISLFWTPEYGTALCSMNSDAYRNNMLLAELKNGEVRYADYHAVEKKLSEDKNELVVTGLITDTPVRYTRIYNFHDKFLHVTIKIQPNQPCEFSGLYEIFPYFKDKQGGLELKFLDSKGSVQKEDKPCAGIFLKTSSPSGVLIRFDEPAIVQINQAGENSIGNLDFLIGTKFSNEARTFGYSLIPCSESELPHIW